MRRPPVGKVRVGCKGGDGRCVQTSNRKPDGSTTTKGHRLNGCVRLSAGCTGKPGYLRRVTHYTVQSTACMFNEPFQSTLVYSFVRTESIKTFY